MFEVLDVFRELEQYKNQVKLKVEYLKDSPKEKITTFKPLKLIFYKW